MPPQHSPPARLRLLKNALWPVAMALGVAACARSGELTPGAIAPWGKPPAVAPWQTLPPAPALAEAPRSLTDREGEVVVAHAIAEHEMRRP